MLKTSTRQFVKRNKALYLFMAAFDFLPEEIGIYLLVDFNKWVGNV